MFTSKAYNIHVLSFMAARKSLYNAINAISFRIVSLSVGYGYVDHAIIMLMLFKYTHVHTYIHTYVHTYVHTYIRTYVRTYIHNIVTCETQMHK